MSAPVLLLFLSTDLTAAPPQVVYDGQPGVEATAHSPQVDYPSANIFTHPPQHL